MRRKALLIVAASIALSFVAGWFAHAISSERSLRLVILGRSLERLNFAANALSLLNSEHPERLEKLLRHGLTTALESAEVQVAQGARLPQGYQYSSMLEGIDRACGVAEDLGDSLTTARLKLLRAALDEYR